MPATTWEQLREQNIRIRRRLEALPQDGWVGDARVSSVINGMINCTPYGVLDARSTGPLPAQMQVPNSCPERRGQMLATSEYTAALDQLENMLPKSSAGNMLLIGAGVLVGGFVLLKILR
jgi:hypothetical protein